MTLTRFSLAAALAGAAYIAPLSANAESFVDGAPFYQLKTTDYVTVCQSFADGCGDIPAGDYLLDTWDADWDGLEKNEPVTVGSTGSGPAEGNLPVASLLSIEYVKGSGGVFLNQDATDQSSRPLADSASSWQASASCPAGTLMTGVVGCGAEFNPSPGEPVPVFTKHSRDFIDDQKANCAVDPAYTLGTLREFPSGTLAISIEVACLSM